MIKYLIILCLCFTSISPLFARDILLTWNRNPETNIKEYKIYKVVNNVKQYVVSSITTSVVTNLQVGDVVGVSAVNTSELESLLSTTVTIPEITTSPPYTILYVSSEELPSDSRKNMSDNNPLTFWHSKWSDPMAVHPHEIRIDLGKEYSVSGLSYLPRQDIYNNGNIGKFEFYITNDIANFGPAYAGEFSNTKSNKTFTVLPKNGRYVKLVILSSANNDSHASIAELKFLVDEIPQVLPPSAPSGLIITEVVSP